MSCVLERIQADFVGRLYAAAYFSDVAIIAQKKAYTENEIAKLLQTVAGRSGKVGACVVVHLTTLGVKDPNLPGPNTAIVQSMTVLEHPTINRQSKGTGKSAAELAVAALQLFHHFIPFGLTQVFIGTPDAISPDDSFEGLSAYGVVLATSVQLAPPLKCLVPKIALSSPTTPTNVTLTCATPGAAIWYTTDDSYPSPENDEAEEYTAPFALASAANLRAAASKTGLEQSDVAQLRIL